jgi:hypothetical protein
MHLQVIRRPNLKGIQLRRAIRSVHLLRSHRRFKQSWLETLLNDVRLLLPFRTPLRRQQGAQNAVADTLLAPPFPIHHLVRNYESHLRARETLAGNLQELCALQKTAHRLRPGGGMDQSDLLGTPRLPLVVPLLPAKFSAQHPLEGSTISSNIQYPHQ